MNAVLSVNHTCHGIDFLKKLLFGALFFSLPSLIYKILWPDLTPKNSIFEISREIFDVGFSFLKRRIELVNAVLSVNPTCHGVDFTLKLLFCFHVFSLT